MTTAAEHYGYATLSMKVLLWSLFRDGVHRQLGLSECELLSSLYRDPLHPGFAGQKLYAHMLMNYLAEAEAHLTRVGWVEGSGRRGSVMPRPLVPAEAGHVAMHCYGDQESALNPFADMDDSLSSAMKDVWPVVSNDGWAYITHTVCLILCSPPSAIHTYCKLLECFCHGFSDCHPPDTSALPPTPTPHPNFPSLPFPHSSISLSCFYLPVRYPSQPPLLCPCHCTAPVPLCPSPGPSPSSPRPSATPSCYGSRRPVDLQPPHDNRSPTYASACFAANPVDSWQDTKIQAWVGHAAAWLRARSGGGLVIPGGRSPGECDSDCELPRVLRAHGDGGGVVRPWVRMRPGPSGCPLVVRRAALNCPERSAGGHAERSVCRPHQGPRGDLLWGAQVQAFACCCEERHTVFAAVRPTFSALPM